MVINVRFFFFKCKNVCQNRVIPERTEGKEEMEWRTQSEVPPWSVTQ